MQRNDHALLCSLKTARAEVCLCTHSSRAVGNYVLRSEEPKTCYDIDESRSASHSSP